MTFTEQCPDCDDTGWVLLQDRPSTVTRCPRCLTSRRAQSWRNIVDREYWDARMETLTQPANIVQTLSRLQATEARSLLLFGPKGSGKTFAAHAVLHSYHMQGQQIATTSAVRMFESLQPDRGAFLEDYTRPAALLIDDLGTEKPSEAKDSALHEIVDARWRQRKLTIVTTNAPPKQLAASIDGRVYDRLTSAPGLALGITRPSQRTKVAA